jgi:hypothetical protein
MIRLDGYTLTTWRRKNGVPIRTWEKPDMPAIVGIEITGRAPHVTWTARLPDGTTDKGLAAKVHDATAHADAWIREQVSQREGKAA